MRSMQEDRAQVAAAQSAPETAAPLGAEAEVHSPEARRPGRPRSEQADKAIIDAALAPGKAETATGRSITASLLFCEPGFGALIIGSSGSSHSVTAALKR